MDFSLSIADTVIIIGSVLVVVLVGLLATRRQDKTARGYFLASGKLRWWIIGAAFVSTSVSSEQIVGTVGAAYKNGMGIANWEWWALPCYTLLIVFFIPIYLRNRIATVPELLTRRYGQLCGDIYSWTMLLAYVFIFMVPILYGGSLAFSELTGWNFYIVLWATILLIALYTVKGGLISVMYTDAVQCIMLLGGGLLLYFLALNHIPGGWKAMEAASPERFHLYHPADDKIAPFAGLVAGTLGLFVFYQATNQVMIQRVLAARSMWDGIMGVIFAGFINLFRPLVTCFLGLIVYHYIHIMKMGEPLTNPDSTFSFALKTFAGTWGLKGIILAGFLAAIMSATSALANSTATIFSLDIYKRLKKDATDQQMVWMGRMVSFLALAVAGILAPHVARFGGIFLYFQKGITYVSTPIISVIIVGILWKRANYASAVFGLIGGVIIQLALVFADYQAGWGFHWFYLAFAAEVLTILGMIIVALNTSTTRTVQSESLVWRTSYITDINDGVKRPWYGRAALWFGIYAVIWFYLYWRFW
ncbi:MAG TPA: sodium/solute symporter [Anaerohalosphaeraceae bacterium]|nr:sodium/solute symporter [Anaerohalosphaeraceae bacterium]